MLREIRYCRHIKPLATASVFVLGSLFPVLALLRYGVPTMQDVPFMPDKWQFAVVWIVFQSAAMVIFWRTILIENSPAKKRKVYFTYIGLMALHLLWGLLYYLTGPTWGCLIIMLLIDLIAVVHTMFLGEIRKPAAFFMAPYLLWLLYATFLCVCVVVANC